jgi:hypothetical protein
MIPGSGASAPTPRGGLAARIHPMMNTNKLISNPESPFNLDGTQRTDVRDTWIGSERAAEEMGVGRTQAWRLAAKWARMQQEHERPPVQVVVMGTEHRPEYKFLLSDVQRYARERRARKAMRSLKSIDQRMRSTLIDLVRKGLLQPEQVPASMRRSVRRCR